MAALAPNVRAANPSRQIQIPEAFEDLWLPFRYKAFYGGRGAAKSHSFATALVTKATQQPLRVLCAREIQRSIKDSVKRLIDDKIKLLGLERFFHSTNTETRGPHGSLFLYEGMHANTDAIKSMEGIDICWVEEANTVSQTSLDLLIPTIRKDGSEIWFSWNNRHKTDPVANMFLGAAGPPPRSVVKKVLYYDNPWFPKELQAEMEWDQKRDIEKYSHIWLGNYLEHSEARVFRNWRVDSMEAPLSLRPYFGGDWGFSNDPTVLIKSFLLPDRVLYVSNEVYKLKCPIDDTPALFGGTDVREPARWTNPNDYPGIPGATEWPIIADSARPETINYMIKRGFHISGARKGPGSIKEGVEFLKSHDIVVHPECKHTIDELTMYAYKTDPLTNAVLSELQDKNNNVIDSLRYAHESVRRSQGGGIGTVQVFTRPRNIPGSR